MVVLSKLTAKLITPIAENTPGRTNEKTCFASPLSAGSTATPRSTTDVTMIPIDTSAASISFRPDESRL
jgi:hypothetical protein